MQKIDSQTGTIAELKASVDSMKGKVEKNTIATAESVKEFKASYADIAKEGFASSGTPRTTKSMQKPKFSNNVQTPKQSTPAATGTSNILIGKPLSPPRNKRTGRQNPEKGVWISGIHRDTTVDEMTNHIRQAIGIEPADFEVHKLVKKDRDISTYRFVSFYIGCTHTNFNRLMDPMYWPSNSQIREFELKQQSSEPSTGERLGQTSQRSEASKNSQGRPNEMERSAMDTTQVTH